MDLDSTASHTTLARLRARFGAPAAQAWWAALPGLIGRLEGEWKLVVGEPLGRGSTALVLRCDGPRGAAFLKLTPEPQLSADEAAALRAWQPTGRVPAVWQADPAAGALLLEGLPSEATISELDAAEWPSVSDAAALISALHGGPAPAASGSAQAFPPLAERIDFLFGLWAGWYGPGGAQAGAVPADALRRGHELARSLAAPRAGVPEVLLHGDLHPGNVIDAGPGRGLVAIDPRACVGDPAFDAIDWVLAAWPGAAGSATAVDVIAAWRRRADELATALGCDPGRLWSWCGAFGAVFAVIFEGRRPPESLAALRTIAA